MTASTIGNILAPKTPFVQCPQCEQKLPLRMSGPERDSSAVWRCAACNVSAEGSCERALLMRNPQSVLLDLRYFEVSDQPEIDAEQRRSAGELANQPPTENEVERRRSTRVTQSLVAPAVALTSNFMPQGAPFQTVVANLSREGVGLVHPGRIEAEFIAMLLGAQEESPIQVIVRLVRHLQLEDPYFEIGGEFLLRLGSVSA
jgi:ribosomal protein L37AE/L43A